MINKEVIKPDEQIPTEMSLTQSHGVSRITVRKAIDELVNEGYLYRIQGKGTFVKAETYNRDLFSICSCTEDIKRMGMEPSRKLIEQGIELADKKRAKIFGINENDDIFVLKRVYLADKEPVNYTISYINSKFFPGIENLYFSTASLYQVIEKKYNVRITKASRTLEAVSVDNEVALLLNMKKSSPVLLFTAVTFGIVNGQEVPIETFKCYYRSDKFKFYINQVR